MKLRIAAIALLVATGAFAQEAKVKQAEPLQPPQKLTIMDCQNIMAGLTALDGHTELSKDNVPVVLAYQFGSAKLRLIIQQNIAALTVMQHDFTKGMQGLFKEIAGDAAEIKPGTPEMARYTKQMVDAQQLPCNAALSRISAADLKLEKNEIPGSVLGSLDKILDK